MNHTSNAPQRYTGVAIALHWLIGAAVLGMIGLGWYMTDIPRGTPERAWFYNLHKSIGVTIAVLVLVRLWWRLTHRPPELPASVPQWQRTASRLSHALLYLCLILLPLVGFISSNFSKYGVKYFGLFQIGPFFDQNKPLYELFQEMHHLIGVVLMTLIIIHVLAALKHLLLDRDGVFQRMLPGARRPAALSAQKR